ncbi:MAG: Rrf2 family transcriptional regulator [Spirochaetes bacterium]|nr:Rrf2 family transcriptional regulator [Spirochaetota bacterium]MBU1080541.1 Rrf2 family transcriptional regulator [Spirochaetota bacterium]
MSCLAKREGRSATSAEIAQSESIPAKYLEGILSRLKASGLIESERGKNGGYRMAKDPAEIRMLEIVEAIDGRIKPVTCVDAPGACSQGGDCHPRNFWIGLKTTIDAYLAERTLKDVSEG